MQAFQEVYASYGEVQSYGGVSLFIGLDYWTGLLDSKFNHKISFPDHQKLLLVLS